MVLSLTVASSMASSRILARLLLFTTPLFGVCGEALAVPDCVVTPPHGPFEVVLNQSQQPPTAETLPSNPGAWSTLITPGPNHRWDSKGGFVESRDGSVVLHGVVSGPAREQSRLHVVVLVDYAPATSAVISGWNAGRTERLDRVVGSHAQMEAEGVAIAFDIELPPITVSDGTYREIQTLVWLEGGSPDARRWTVYAGPIPPAAIKCDAGDSGLPDMPTRTRLEPDGGFVVRSPRVTTLAVVPFSAAGPGAVQFLRIDQAGHGWESQLGKGLELAAVWEGPFTGPGRNWISSFWSARSR